MKDLKSLDHISILKAIRLSYVHYCFKLTENSTFDLRVIKVDKPGDKSK